MLTLAISNLHLLCSIHHKKKEIGVVYMTMIDLERVSIGWVGYEGDIGLTEGN